MRNRQPLRILAPLLLLATAFAVATAPVKFPAGLQVLIRLEPSSGDIVPLQGPPVIGSREPVVYKYSITTIEPSHPETSYAHAETVVLPGQTRTVQGGNRSVRVTGSVALVTPGIATYDWQLLIDEHPVSSSTATVHLITHN
jgi:hypothetical protein